MEIFYGCALRSNVAGSKGALDYPVTRKVAQNDNYHGTTVADPYRWLEDDHSEETKAWVQAQNKVTFNYLEGIPRCEQIRKRLTELWNYPRYGVPFREGNRYFYSRNDGLQNQAVLYTLTDLEAEPTILLDPNQLSADGTIALAGFAVSQDGKRLAYGLSKAGSDWQEWRVRDVESRQDLSDRIRWVKTGAASWSKDGSGFFYSRYDEPDPRDEYKGLNYFQKLYYHRLGSSQTEDTLIYSRPDQKEWGFSGGVTDDGRFLVIAVWHGTDTRNRVFYKDLEQTGSEVVPLLNDFDADYSFIDNVGPVFYFRTDQAAPMGRVIAINVTQPARANWRELIPERKQRLQSVSLVNRQFVAAYLKDAASAVEVFSLEGKPVRPIGLPGIGTAAGFGGKQYETETFYSHASFTGPARIYRLDMRTGASTVFRQPKLEFDPERFETRQIFYQAKDGTRIPMFIAHKKGLRLNAHNPTLLYGYGGFDISLTPSFSPATLVWMEMGGVYAQPSLRGGGEYGQAWHEAGMKHRKQTVFDDFMAAAEWLVQNRYTRSSRLAIWGGSNGGLLVGACMTQRPDLFGAALPAVGVMDMLRFNKFTRGWAWTSEYGSPENAEDFKVLYAYSPLHRIQPGTAYPPTLITTADHDDRVVPAHSFKFAAALQAAQAGTSPVLIRIETSAGHGAGKPTSKVIEEATDKLAFITRVLGM